MASEQIHRPSTGPIPRPNWLQRLRRSLGFPTSAHLPHPATTAAKAAIAKGTDRASVEVASAHAAAVWRLRERANPDDVDTVPVPLVR
jgi:hypothetical protein